MHQTHVKERTNQNRPTGAGGSQSGRGRGMRYAKAGGRGEEVSI